MIILFIITICSLWGAMGTLSYVNEIIPQHGFNFTKNTWVFWCWLPIPIASIILGFIYNGKGLKCTKNIVAGFIIGFLLSSKSNIGKSDALLQFKLGYKVMNVFTVLGGYFITLIIYITISVIEKKHV